MKNYSLNLDVLYHIAEKYPSINLTLVNKDMKACIDKVYKLAVNYIEKELPSFIAKLSLDKSTMNGMEYFTKLTDELCLEGKRLDILDLVLDSQLSPADRMLRNYVIFRNLVENIKLETSKAIKEDFNKFVKAVFKLINENSVEHKDFFESINYHSVEHKYFKDVWNDFKNKSITNIPLLLDLSNQNMRFLPREIGDLKNLRYLNLDNNKLKFIPEEVNYLSSLKELRLNNNQIEFFSNSLSSLEKLKLRRNNLREVPNINNFPNIKTMSLEGNKIKTIPSKSFTDSHPCLHYIHISENPLTMPSRLLIVNFANVERDCDNFRFEDVS